MEQFILNKLFTYYILYYYMMFIYIGTLNLLPIVLQCFINCV